ncbi:MAG: hypothetical protein FD152_3795 [Xanthobacteraceae bacterium]|nr:MAG: hypothetical protein FD152_3795 [Xanthobacteraceae bacterium]
MRRSTSWDKFYGEAANTAAFPILNKIMSFGNEHTFDNIRSLFAENKIWLSRRSDFNDPFDIAPIIEADLRLSQYRERQIHIDKIDPKTIPDDDFFRIMQLKQLPKKSNGKLIKTTIDRSVRSSINHLLDATGVYCLSGTWNSQLLWSHYGNGHTGICIRFRLTKSARNFIVEPVRYVTSRARISASSFWTGHALHPFEPQWNEHFRPMFFDKYADWKYECEYRIVRPDSARTHFQLSGLEPFEIIFGCRTAENDILQTISILQKCNSQFEVYQLMASSDTYDFDRHMLHIKY